MARVSGVTRFQNPTTGIGTTIDVTIPGFGTPDAAMFFWTEATSDNTIIDDGVLGIGFTDGTNNYSTVTFSNHGNSSTAVNRRSNATMCVLTLGEGSTIYCGLAHNSWITDGIRLEVVDTSSTVMYITCVFFKGDNTTAGEISLGTGTSELYQNIGFRPDLIFLIGNCAAIPSTSANFGTLTYGAAIDDSANGSIIQKGFAYSLRDNVATTENYGFLNDSCVGGQQPNNGTNINYILQCTSIDSAGFGITPSASSGGDEIAYLAIDFDSTVEYALFDATISSTSSWAETSPGFLPETGISAFYGGKDHYNTQDSGSRSDVGITISAFDSATAYSTSMASVDARDTTSIEKSFHTNEFKGLSGSDGTIDFIASGHTLDSSGWDFTFSDYPTNDLLGFALAFGTTGGGTTPPDSDVQMHLHLSNVWTLGTPYIFDSSANLWKKATPWTFDSAANQWKSG